MCVTAALLKEETAGFVQGFFRVLQSYSYAQCYSAGHRFGSRQVWACSCNMTVIWKHTDLCLYYITLMSWYTILTDWNANYSRAWFNDPPVFVSGLSVWVTSLSCCFSLLTCAQNWHWKVCVCVLTFLNLLYVEQMSSQGYKSEVSWRWKYHTCLFFFFLHAGHFKNKISLFTLDEMFFHARRP